MTLPSVLPMRPWYVEKLWGGARLARLPAKQRAGHAPPSAMRVGESWEVADLPEGSSVVDAGPLEGLSLRQVVEKFGVHVTGGPARFPLLVKMIDAGDDLSVQVHPDEAWARTHPAHFAKDEAWLVVDTAPGARVLHGFRDGTTAKTFRAAIEAGRPEQLLREVRVSVGDLLRIRPGTMHAVGRGCLLLEVQEPSDTTFRVWDYARTDKHGKARALHVEEAMAVARFGPQDPPLVGDAQAGAARLRAEKFSLGLIDVRGRARIDKATNEPAVLFVLDGTAHAGGFTIPAGGAAIVPACVDQPIDVEGNATVVVMSTR